MSDYFKVEKTSEIAFKREMEVHKGIFITETLEKAKAKLGIEEFEKKREKLTQDAEARWLRIRKARSEILDVEERMQAQPMKWNPLERLYREWLEARGDPKEWIENTVKARRQDFEIAQHQVQERLKAAAYDPAEDFKQKMLDPKTRQDAIQHYLFDSADKPHFLIETVKLLFEELDKLKRR